MLLPAAASALPPTVCCTEVMVTSVVGLSALLRGTTAMLSITARPETTRPNTA